MVNWVLEIGHVVSHHAGARAFETTTHSKDEPFDPLTEPLLGPTICMYHLRQPVEA
jgi:hypothetical protein